MKKFSTVAKVAIGFFMFFIVVTVSVISDGAVAKRAEAQEEIEEKLESAVDDRLNGIDMSELERFYAEFSENKSFGGTVKEIVKKITEGQAPDAKSIINSLFNALKSGFTSLLPMLVSVISLSVLSAVAISLSSGFKKESTKKIVRFATYGATVAIIIGVVTSSVVSVKDTLSALSKLCEIIFPVLLTLTTAVGGVSSVAQFQPLVALGGGLVLGLMLKVVVPLFIATFTFGAIGNLSDSVPLGKLTKTTKSLSDWIMGIVFGVYVFALSVAGIVGSTSDTISIKSVKFALSSYVPVLGGYISDGFDIVLASGLIVKNAVGVVGLILVASIFVLPVIKLIALSLTLKLGAAAVEPLGDTQCSEFLYATGKSLNTLIAVVLGVAFIMCSIMLVAVYSCNSGVV